MDTKNDPIQQKRVNLFIEDLQNLELMIQQYLQVEAMEIVPKEKLDIWLREINIEISRIIDHQKFVQDSRRFFYDYYRSIFIRDGSYGHHCDDFTSRAGSLYSLKSYDSLGCNL